MNNDAIDSIYCLKNSEEHLMVQPTANSSGLSVFCLVGINLEEGVILDYTSEGYHLLCLILLVLSISM